MQLNSAIYLDYNATTPVDPAVMNAMLPYFLTGYGNPSSADHVLGWQAKEALEQARLSIASSLSVKPGEIVFTAGATEALNILLRGLTGINQRCHVITVKTEHNAVLDTCAVLENAGVEVTYLDVDIDGLISLEELKEALRPETAIVAIMWVNNETGVMQPIDEIATICKQHDVIFISDATQAVGKLQIKPKSSGVHAIVGSAHKLYGPKGVGFLYLQNELMEEVQPQITGGGQEMGKRAGTSNLPGIIGLSAALAIALQRLDEDRTSISLLRDRFEAQLQKRKGIKINGSKKDRLYNTSNICFTGFDSERIMQAIGARVAASRGSACSTGKIEPSHVLSAMGMTEKEAHASIRFSFGRFTTEQEVERAIEIIMGSLDALS